MQYINPIEILGLSNVADTTKIDIETIKKAKRKLFADIDLSDNGFFEYYGLKLTKGDCEKAIDQLANNDLKEFYLYLASNKKLNSFLVNGNDDVFTYFKQDGIFKLPEFITFISTYFAPKFDKVLLNAFENGDVEKTKSILKTSFLISQSDINIAFKGVTNHINSEIYDVDEITKEIRNENSAYNEITINGIIKIVQESFPNQILNCLPQYFQSQILKIANSLNYLNVAIWEKFDNTQVCNDLLEHILTLNIGGLDKPTFEKNYLIVKKKNEERKAEEKFSPILKKYASYIIEIKSKIDGVKNKTISSSTIKYWVEDKIKTNEINQLDSTFNELKSQVAIHLKILSVEIWNNYSDLETSFYLITIADSISNIEVSFKKIISEAKSKLLDIAIDREIKKPTYSTPKNYSSSSSNSDNNGCWWIFGIIIIFAIIFNCNSNKNSSNNSNDSYVDPQSIVDTVATTYNDSAVNNEVDFPIVDSTVTNPIQSPYTGNQLKDGASPLTGCFGKGIYSGKATLTIKNGGNSDAIICLYSISNDRTIRNEYVQKNSSFTMSNIAQGEYKIRVFYGNDWNPDLENSCGTKGNFETDVNFSEFDGTEYFEDSNRGFTNATITLYTVSGGNASSSAIDQSQFFRK